MSEKVLYFVQQNKKDDKIATGVLFDQYYESNLS